MQKKCGKRFFSDYFRCGTHSAAQGHTIEQDLSKGYPNCCAKLVKVQRRIKHVNYDAATVKINKFRARERSGGRTIELTKVPKETETTSPTESTQEESTKIAID